MKEAYNLNLQNYMWNSHIASIGKTPENEDITRCFSKEELVKSKQSETERRIQYALEKKGIYLVPQFRLSEMHLDFYDKKAKIFFEIDGPHHQLPYFKACDKRRDFMTKKLTGLPTYRVPVQWGFYNMVSFIEEIHNNRIRTGSNYFSHKLY